jgi:hypothetical protein
MIQYTYTPIQYNEEYVYNVYRVRYMTPKQASHTQLTLCADQDLMWSTLRPR